MQADRLGEAQGQAGENRGSKRDTHRHEGGDFLAVLDELYTHALADGRVGLLRLDADLLEDDTLRVRRATSGRGLVDVPKRALFVALIRLWTHTVCQ